MKKIRVTVWAWILLLMFLTLTEYLLRSFVSYNVPFSSLASEDFVFLCILILSGAAILILRHKLNWLKKKSGFTGVLLITLFFIAFFAPVIAIYNPGELIHGDLRLLSPFSHKTLITNSNGDLLSHSREVMVVDSSDYSSPNVYYKYSHSKGKMEVIEVDYSNYREVDVFFLLGTTEVGADLFSEMVWGARKSLIIGLLAALGTAIIASLFSMLSGFGGKITDSLVNKFSELFLAVPSLFIVIFVVALVGNTLFSIILVLSAAGWMPLYKILRGEIQRIRTKNFIQSSIQLGISKKKIFIKEIIPLILPIVIVNLIFQVANFIIVEASLSFLGLGPGGNYPSWGKIIDSGVDYMQQAWWLLFFPSLVLFVTIMLLNKTGSYFEKLYSPYINA